MASLEAEHFRGSAHVAVILVQLLENVVALIGGSRLMQSRSFAARDPTTAIAVYQRRQMLALELALS